MRGKLDKLSTQILRFIPLVLAFLVPLFFLPVTTDFFGFNKFYLVSFLASLSLIAWCIRSLTRGKLTFTSSPSLLPLIILILANIVSSVWISQTKHVSLFGQTTLFTSLTLIFITTTSSQKNRALVNSVIFGLISSAVILSLVTILHRFDLLSKVISSDLLTNKSFNLTGSILSALTFTLPVLIATIGYLIASKNRLAKSLLFASAIFMIVASLINLTLILPQNGQRVLVTLPYRASWYIAVDTFKNWQTTLLGFGPETYFTTFTRLKPMYLNLDNTLWLYRFPESGSFFLTLITTTGLIGALSFILSFIKPAIISIKHRSNHLDDPSFMFLSLALISTLLSFLFIPVGVVTLVLGFVSLIALTVEFKLLGLKNVRDLNLSISAKSEPENIYHEISEDEKYSPSSFILPWILTLVSVLLIAIYWFYAIPAYRASVSAKQAEEMVNTNGVGAYLKAVNSAQLDPFNKAFPLSLSRFYKTIAVSLLSKKDATEEDKKNATDYMQRAIDSGRMAAKLDPLNVTSYENLFSIYQSFIGSANGAENFAIAHLNQAIILDPTNPGLRLQLGALFFNLGDTDQAIKLLNQALELKQDWDIPYYNLSAIYKYKKDYPRALQYAKAGLQYTSQTSEDYPTVLAEIKTLEKLVPLGNTATPSATTK